LVPIDTFAGVTHPGRDVGITSDNSTKEAAMYASNHIARAATAALWILPFVAMNAGAAAADSSARPHFTSHVTQARVNDDLIGKVQPGMSGTDLTTLLGKPNNTVTFPLASIFAWNYNYVDAWGYDAVFSVIFDTDGRVVSKANTRRRY
jgi:hypothetical protein